VSRAQDPATRRQPSTTGHAESGRLYKVGECRQAPSVRVPDMYPNANGDIVTAQTVPDPVTGLPGRGLFVERLSRSIERSSQYPGFHFAVLRVALDRPEGRADGSGGDDVLLSTAARRLEASLRVREMPPTLRHDDVVARLDGPCFGILLDGLKDVAHATVVAERILAGMLEPFMVDGREERLVACVGVALSPTGYAQADDVLHDADSAAQRARLLGGCRCEVFDTEVLKIAQSELRLEADFSGAIEREEFFLLYQPIVSLASNQVVGFEALVRWQHPVLGLIAPLEFIPLAERTGFIVTLGQWVLSEACRQLKAWQDVAAAADVWMSVNLSSVQFKRPALVEEISATLRDSGLEPRRLILELTESIAMDDPAAVRASLLQLRAIGVRVSLDDFGTGHSSLAYLRQFPLDSLKVDRSFVRGIENSGDMASIVNAVKSMAHQLGLRVVAEGIEKDEQLALLRALDCEMGQGYLFSRPIDADAAAAMLTAGLPAREPVAVTRLPAIPMRTVNARAARAGSRWRDQRTRRWLYAAVGVAVLVLSVGLPRLTGTPEPDVPPGAPGSPDGIRAALGTDIPLPPRPAEPVPAVPSPSRAARRREAASAGLKTVRDTASAAVVTPAPVEPTMLTSLRVVHQHRLGSCRGLLVVTRSGVEYQPDEAEHQAKDGFVMPFTRFLSEKSGDSLIIKSNDRDYRFKAAVEGRGGDHIEQLDAAIARLR